MKLFEHVCRKIKYILFFFAYLLFKVVPIHVFVGKLFEWKSGLNFIYLLLLFEDLTDASNGNCFPHETVK